MAGIGDVKKNIEKIEDSVKSLLDTQARCRYDQQVQDHDELTKLGTKFETMEADQKEMKDNQAKISENLEIVSGNLNQSMLIIKDLQTANRLKASAKTTIITSVIATMISAVLIYIGTIFLSEMKADQSVYLNSVKNLNLQNKLLLKELRLGRTPPVSIKVEETINQK